MASADAAADAHPPDGTLASATTGLVEAPAAPVTCCWKCKGTASKLVKTGPGVVEAVPCPLCRGSGQLQRGAKRRRTANSATSTAWTPVGPSPAQQPDTVVLAEGETLSFLTGAWRIVQGQTHRYSTDDVVTAYVASHCAGVLHRLGGASVPAALRMADIGCGIGSVLLMNAWLNPSAICVGVEAQEARAALARRSIAVNGCGDRVQLRQGDLRDAALLPPHAFDIVTGTPPYFDVATGAPPGSEESARCLFRYRGGMEAYCDAAARLLARPHGLFVVVETALELQRSYAAAAAAGLRVLGRLDVVPAADKPPLINVFVMCRDDLASAAFFGLSGSAAGSDGAAAEAAEATGRGFFTAAELVPHGRPPYDAPTAAADAGDAATTAATTATSGKVPAGSASIADAPIADLAADSADPAAGPHLAKRRKQKSQQPRPYPGALRGEAVHTIQVRGADGERTPEYKSLLRELGKPG